MSSETSQPAAVISLNSMTQASLVVKALRSQKASRERYQDFNQNSLDVKSLNSAILIVKKEQGALASKKAEIDTRIDSWTASSIRPEASIGRINETSNRDDSEDESNQQMSAASKGKVPASADDDFDFDDDPDDNRELFKGFVAPKSNRSGGGGSITGKGPISSAATNKISSSTSATQQPSLITSKGIVIKPGQAIRVKARGNRTKNDANLDY